MHNFMQLAYLLLAHILPYPVSTAWLTDGDILVTALETNLTGARVRWLKASDGC